MGRAAILVVLLPLILISSTRAQVTAELPPTALPNAGPSEMGPFFDNAAPYCAEQPRYYIRGEYVFWVIGTGKLVEMAQEAYNSNFFNALLDASGKTWGDVIRTLLGNDRNGFRISAGGWLDDAATVGVEANFLHVNRSSPLVLPILRRDLNPLERILNDQAAVIEVNPNLAPTGERIDRPLLALLLLRRLGVPALDDRGRQVVVPLGRRDLADAQVTFEIARQTFWALDLLGRTRLFDCDGLRVDGVAGYRRVYYEDNMSVRADVVTLARPLLPGTRLMSTELIRTENTYDGALVGVDLEAQCGSWTFAIRPTATIACLNAEVTRDATSIVSLPSRERIGFAGGTYLRAADVGTFSTSQWTVIPEIGLRATCALTQCVGLTFGTSFIYLPEAARAAPQLDLGLDPDRTLPGSVGTPQGRDVFPPVLKSVFMAALSMGIEIRY
jgi:hypothetical protein